MSDKNYKYDVFISYSNADQKVVEGICGYLERNNYRCFVAYRDISPSEVWAKAIAEAIDVSRMMIAVFSENFNISEQTDREIELAAENKIPILTFRISKSQFTGAKKYYLKNINWIDAFPNPEKAFGQLFDNVKKLLGNADGDQAEIRKREAEERIRRERRRQWLRRHRGWLFGIPAVVLMVLFVLLMPHQCDGIEPEDVLVDTVVEEVVEIVDTGTVEDGTLTKDSLIARVEESSSNLDVARIISATGTIVGHAYVDLGLSVKWATCNVGATNPEDYGGYYAWGETETKREYTKGNSRTYGKPLSDISGDARYDVARAKWGGSWRMPTKSELEELNDKCQWQWTRVNGVYGYKVTGPNGNSIFLPAAGNRLGSKHLSVGSYGVCWSSTPLEDGGYGAYVFCFFDTSMDVNWIGRNLGHSIRPVSE